MLPYEDRVVEHPNRVKLVPVEGTTDEFDLVPVPGKITSIGRAMNKIFFDSIKTSIADAKSNLDVFAASPENPVNGQLYCDSYFNDVFVYVNGQWKSLFMIYREFTENIVPITGWAGDSTSISSSNEYGEWKISNNQSVSADVMSRISDNDIDTSTRTTLDSATATFDIEIELEKRLKVSTFEISTQNVKNGYIYGYDESTSAWEFITDVFENTSADSYKKHLLTCLSDKFYTKFKISAGRYSSSKTIPYIFEFIIKEGTIMIPKD